VRPDFDSFYRAERPQAVRTATRLTQNRAVAEELVHAPEWMGANVFTTTFTTGGRLRGFDAEGEQRFDGILKFAPLVEGFGDPTWPVDKVPGPND
jgi:hypothetical protein